MKCQARQWLIACSLACLVLACVGCTCKITPQACTPGDMPTPPVLRIGDIKEKWSMPMAGQMPAGRMLADPIREALRKGGPGKGFSSDLHSLVLDLNLDIKSSGNEEAMISAVICGLTLGIAPVHIPERYDVTCEATVRTPEGTPVRAYSVAQHAERNLWAYPPGLFTLIGALPSEMKWYKELQEAAVTHLVSKLVEQLAPDHAAFVEAKSTRLAALSRPPAPVAPVAPQPAPQTPVPSVEPLPPIAQRWAVIIGVNEYKHAGVGGLTNLRYAARDAQEVHDRLVAAGPAAWPKENIRLLTNQDATERAVREALLTFLKKAQRDDLVLIFFSGHGSPDPTRPQNSYFLCHDTEPEKLTTTGFPMWEIDNALERGIIEAKRVVVLADACHSGGFAPEGMKDIRVVSRSVSEGIQALGKKAACRVVTSCEPGELSQEKADWGSGHGAFAYALVKGLSGSADSASEKNARGNADGKVDLDELVYYLRREVGDLTSNAQHVQDTGRLNAIVVSR